MYARVVQAQAKSGKMNEFLRVFKDELAPEIQKDAGFAQSFVTVEGDSLLIFTVYSSKDDVEASEAAFRRRVAKVVDLFVDPPEAKVREVAIHLG